MTSIRDLFGESLAVGETFCLPLEVDDDGERNEGGGEEPRPLVADHPNPNSPADIAVVEGLEYLEEHKLPPSEPVEVEIVGRFVENRIAGRIVGLECERAENRGFE
ncbi:hypothetical protein [Natronoglomus mannanivorans]|uniref:Uncharacterized protein n=1 Tax=Natronoglomus mannanivorans TaxID=2979990 RepID=A0AAP2Z3U3_9EURY|nr:hypothetical protein [Halobacteria archaeon AArc-xg1-1]